VVDSDIAQDTYRPRLSVHLDDHGMRAKGKWGSRQGVSAAENQPAPPLHRAMCPAGGSSYKLGEGQLLIRLMAIERVPALETNVLGGTGEQLRGEMRQVLARFLYHGIDSRAAHDETATGTSAFAERKEVGVAMAHAHLRGMHAQLISDDLGKRRL